MMEEPILTIWNKIFELKEDAVVGTLIRHRGVIYGGALRDMLRGLKPNDLDVIISQYEQEEFNSDMKSLGYEPGEVCECGTTMWTLDGHIPVESYTVEDDPATTFIGPVSDPDYDVNLLRFDGATLRNWITSSEDVSEIIKHIHSGVTLPVGEKIKPDREAKIQARRFKILPDTRPAISTPAYQPYISLPFPPPIGSLPPPF